MLLLQLAALGGAVLAGRLAARHGHPVELVMATFLLVCGLAVEVSR
jgi:hypothetical protein